MPVKRKVALLAVVLVVILAAMLAWRATGPVAPSRLPADTLLYAECSAPTELADDPQAIEELDAWLAAYLGGQDNGLPSLALLAHADTAAAALVPRGVGDAEWVLVLEVDDPAEALASLGEQPGLTLERTEGAGLGGAPVWRLGAGEPGALRWAAAFGKVLFVAESAEALRAAHAAPENPQDTLAGRRDFQDLLGESDRPVRVYVDGCALAARPGARGVRADLGAWALGHLGRGAFEARPTDEGAWTVRGAWTCTFQSRSGADAAAAPAGATSRGWRVRHWVLAAVLTPVVLVVGVVVLFGLAMVVLAAWYYVLAWRRGTLYRKIAPEPVPGSAALRETLGADAGSQQEGGPPTDAKQEGKPDDDAGSPEADS